MNMRGFSVLGVLAAGLAGGCEIYAGAGESIQPRQGINYPTATRGPQSDDFFNVKVADPYRWLEDTESPQAVTWINEENTVTETYFASIPERAKIKDRLTKLWNYERFGIPFTEGGKYFYTRNDGLQNQAVLYTADALDGPARILLDPNTFKADGTIAFDEKGVSKDAKYIA